jgi:TRAP transporter TAXI family solute receptor
MIFTRRHLVCGLPLAATFGATAMAQDSAIVFMTAGDGSAFLPYGQAVAVYLAKKGIHVDVRKSGGSNDNLMAVESSPRTIGTAFMASAYEAVNGTGFAAGHKHENLRALFPMYETSFQVAALRKSGLHSLRDLDGKKVGVGPAKGPAEGFFRAAAEVAGIKPVIVNGDPAALSKQVLNGEIDALWQGAVVPIPSLVDVANHAEAIVFGPSEADVAAVLAKLPALSATTIPPGTYKGQTEAIKSFSAWNFVVANKDLPDEIAYAITKAVLSATDPASEIYPTASGTRAANAFNNRILPLHPGALKFIVFEAGVSSLPAHGTLKLQSQPPVAIKPPN